MADRSIRVRLQAEVGSYIAGMRNAAQATSDLASQIQQEAVQNQEAWNDVGAVLLTLGGTAGVAFGLITAKTAEFEAAMSNVAASTRASTDEIDLLKDAALQAGAQTVFSSSEAAGAIEELSKAGISTADILTGGLNGALSLAAAGGLEVADAAELAASAMTQFSLAGQDLPHVADLLAAAAGKAQGSVGDLGAALNQSGLVADQIGLSIEETTGGLAAFASAGLLGSDAGTSFKTMLQSLIPNSEKAAELMSDIGFSAFDAQGQFVGLETVAGRLRTSLKDMNTEQRTATLKTLFGSDAVRAASVLYDQGAEGIGEWIEKVNDQGFAAETAALKLDNLKGDLEALGGAFDTALIKSGSASNAALRGLTQEATNLVNAYSALPAPVQSTVGAVAGIGAAVGLGAGAFLLAVPKVAAFRDALGTMGPGTQRAAASVGSFASKMAGPFAIALIGGISLLKRYGEETERARVTQDGFVSALTTSAGKVDKVVREQAIASLDTAFEGRRKLLDKILDSAGGLDRVIDGLTGTDEQYRAVQKSAGLAGYELDELREGFQDGLTIYARNQSALEDTVVGTDNLRDSQLEAAEATEKQRIQLEEMRDAAIGVSEALLGIRSDQRGFQAAVDAADEALKKNGKGLDITGEKGRENAAALDAVAASGLRILQGMRDAGASDGEVARVLGAQRTELYNTARQFGLSKDAARDYINEMMRIPPKVETRAAIVLETNRALLKIDLDTTEALLKIEAMQRKLGNLPSSVTSEEFLSDLRRDRAAAANGPIRRANGGWVTGPGGPKDDRVRLLASNGEYVVNARSAGQYGGLLEAINAGTLRTGTPARGGMGADDVSRIALALANMAPRQTNFDVTVQTDRADQLMREMAQRERLANLTGSGG